jgi:hypothetical protein
MSTKKMKVSSAVVVDSPRSGSKGMRDDSDDIRGVKEVIDALNHHYSECERLRLFYNIEIDIAVLRLLGNEASTSSLVEVVKSITAYASTHKEEGWVLAKRLALASPPPGLERSWAAKKAWLNRKAAAAKKRRSEQEATPRI